MNPVPREAAGRLRRLLASFAALRHAIDRAPGNGRFVLTGSASPAPLASAAESLAGRIGLLELTPFRPSELAGTPGFGARWFWGGYPPVHARRCVETREPTQVPDTHAQDYPARLRELLDRQGFRAMDKAEG